MFSDRDILAAHQTGTMKIVPLDCTRLQPASLDVCLGDIFATLPEGETFTLSDPPSVAHYNFHEGPFHLEPGGFVLGSTLETFHLGLNVVAQLEGKSSIGRLGVLVHVTAGLIDPGFEGDITLEIANLSKNNIILEPGIPIGQLTFHPMLSRPSISYGDTGQYNGQRGPTPSRGVRVGLV